MGALLFIFFFIVSISAFLLGIKKHSGGMILAKTYKGSSTELKDWLPLDSLHQIACQVLKDSVGQDLSTTVQRIDVRKEKGTVKFSFEEHYWGLQLDGATGKLLHIEYRASDLIENIHDGSILDRFFGTGGNYLKLFYSVIMSLALLTFTITGFWLWYGPKRMRKANRQQKK